MIKYPPNVLETIGQAHKDVGDQLFRAGVKELIFLGGGSSGEPCITKLTGYDRRHRPPIVELEGAFPKLASIKAWLPVHEPFLDRQTVRLAIDPEDGRPADGTIVTISTDHGVFTGTVGHRGAAWCLNWTCLFTGKPLEAAVAASSAT